MKKINLKLIIIIILIFIIFNMPLPYYIDAPGGISNVDKEISLKGYKSSGIFNMVYVKEYNTNIPMIIYSMLRKDYDIIKKSDILLKHDTEKEYQYRDKILMDESISNATFVAYTKANKEIKVLNNKLFVLYNTNPNSNLKVYDEILKINDVSVNSKSDIENLLSNLDAGDKVKISVKNKEKEYLRYAKIMDDKKLGILLSNIREYKTNPSIKINKGKNESGSSGGLIMALYIYNTLIKEDITHGKKIVGTGTIELDGTIGEIGGIKYKLKSAVKSKADLFIVPKGNNCTAAKKIKDKEKYNIEIVCSGTFDEVINYLENAN